MVKAQRTDERLVQAAMAEFCDHGFAGTDTNRIARRAGFAPQTFYRWFKDKTMIFLAAYRAWEEEERSVLGVLKRSGRDTESVIDAIVAHHSRHRLFRRSLRALSLDVPEVRKARAESRRRQADRIATAAGTEPALGLEGIIVRLLQIERLADALAEGELADLGLGENIARARLTELLTEIRGASG